MKNNLPYDDQEAMLEDDLSPTNLPLVGKGPASKYFMANPELDPNQSLALNETQETVVDSPAVERSPSATELQTAKYEKMLADIKAAQDTQMQQRSMIDMGRGANKIAEAIASGYGAKIGDNSAQSDALTKTADEPVENLLKQYKLQKEASAGRQSPYGFGAFTNKAGEPLVMLPDGTAWNVVQKREHKVEEGVIPRAVDKTIKNSDGTYDVVKPGIDTSETLKAKSLGTSLSGLDTSSIPKSPYEAYSRLPERYKNNLDKDVDQFQQEVKDALRIKSELVNAGPILEQAKTNPAAGKAVGALIAQIFQGGRLTDSDVDLYVGRLGAGNWLQDTYSKLVEGVQTPEMLDQVKEYIDLYSNNLEKTLPQRAKLKAQTMAGSFDPKLNIPSEMIQERYYSSKNSENSGDQTIMIRHKATGETQKVKQSSAKKYLDRPEEFEQVK